MRDNSKLGVSQKDHNHSQSPVTDSKLVRLRQSHYFAEPRGLYYYIIRVTIQKSKLLRSTFMTQLNCKKYGFATFSRWTPPFQILVYLRSSRVTGRFCGILQAPRHSFLRRPWIRMCGASTGNFWTSGRVVLPCISSVSVGFPSGGIASWNSMRTFEQPGE